MIWITPNQLKETNLIFAEHGKLLVENSLLVKQIKNLETSYSILSKTDSLRVLQLNNYKELAKSYDSQITDLNKRLEKKEKSLLVWEIGGITISAGLLLWLILK